MTEPTHIIGTPDRAPRLPSSKRVLCTKCGSGCWLAPSGMRRRKYENLLALCFPCFRLEASKDANLEIEIPSLADLLGDLRGGDN